MKIMCPLLEVMNLCLFTGEVLSMACYLCHTICCLYAYKLRVNKQMTIHMFLRLKKLSSVENIITFFSKTTDAICHFYLFSLPFLSL